MMVLSKEITICSISKHYEELFNSFICKKKLTNINFNKTKISEAIFYHLCKMKYSGWKHKIYFHRHRKHTFADYFQDIIAYYLAVTLPNNYQVISEIKIHNTQPDILIKRNDKNYFIIEIKTNIGWNRPDGKSINPYKEFETRIAKLSENFQIHSKNIIYVFEEHSNVSNEFSGHFWDKDREVPQKRPKEFPFSKIYPLFNGTDPYYWKHERGFDRKKKIITLSDNDILEKAKTSIVTPFESIIKMINK